MCCCFCDEFVTYHPYYHLYSRPVAATWPRTPCCPEKCIHNARSQQRLTVCMPRRLSSCYNDDLCSKLDLGPGHPRQRRQLRLLVHLDDVNGLGQQLLRVSCYGTWLPYMYHTCIWRMGGSRGLLDKSVRYSQTMCPTYSDTVY